MKTEKGRSSFSREELLEEIRFFEAQETRHSKEISESYSKGRIDTLKAVEVQLKDLYYSCFVPGRGWIGTSNLHKVGSKLLCFLALFHERFGHESN